MSFLWVALGGALGAMGRYAISLLPVKSIFPVLTLITNLVGAVVTGFIAGIAGTKENILPIIQCTALFIWLHLCMS